MVASKCVANASASARARSIVTASVTRSSRVRFADPPGSGRCYIRRQTCHALARPAVRHENYIDELAPSASRCTAQSSHWAAAGSVKTVHDLNHLQVFRNDLTFVRRPSHNVRRVQRRGSNKSWLPRLLICHAKERLPWVRKWQSLRTPLLVSSRRALSSSSAKKLAKSLATAGRTGGTAWRLYVLPVPP